MESFEISVESTMQAEDGNLESEVSPRRWGQREEPDEPATLEPDHPLMKRFQASLKEHLSRQYARLTEEVLGLKGEVKMKQQERQTSAEAMFYVEQEVARQHSQLADYNKQFAELTMQRDEMDALVRESKQKLEAENQLLADSKAREIQLMAEMEQLNMVESQLKTWTEQTETDLGATQRMSEKAKLDKKQLAAEKRKQDLFLFRLQLEVSRLESELTTLQRLQRDKEKERDAMDQSAGDADMALQRINGEQKRLLQSWSRVVVAVNARDRQHSMLHKQLVELQNKLSTLVNEIEAEKKVSAQEQLANQELTLGLHRAEAQAAALKHAADIRVCTKAAVEDEFATLLAALEATQHAINTLKVETAMHEAEYADEQKQLDRIEAEKRAIEDQLLAYMLEMETNDKVVTYGSKIITKLRDAIRQQELMLVEMESAVMRTSLATEQQANANHSAKLLLVELKAEEQREEELVAANNMELKHAMTMSDGRLGHFNSMYTKLEHMVSKVGGYELGPSQLKQYSLGMTLKETIAKNAKLHQHWFRKEAIVVRLAQKRNCLLSHIIESRKYVSILEQMGLTSQRQLDERLAEQTAISRATNILINRMQTLDMNIYLARGSTQEVDIETRAKQAACIDALKRCELKWLKKQSELRQIQEDNTQLSKQLVAVHRQSLATDSRLMLALEVRTAMENETAKDGEVSTMRSEIHRMQVRYSQLRRVLEKLAADLDHCVSRRDTIVDQSEAMERRAGADRKKWNSRVNELQLKLANNQTSTRKIQADLRRAERDVDELQAQLALRRADLSFALLSAREQNAKLSDVERRRLCTDAQLARRQTKVRLYTNIRQGTHRLLFKSEQDLLVENHKQRSFNSDMILALETSAEDFPALSHDLEQVLDLLRLPSA